MAIKAYFKASFSVWPIVFIWFVTAGLTLASGFLFLNYRQILDREKRQADEMAFTPRSSYYQMYASQPKVFTDTVLSATTQDGVPFIVKNYLERYKSPMLASADALVSISRKYEINPLLMVAIAQCESNLGKKMPEDCHNPFGWGIHSAGTLCFQNWEEGYEKVAKGLREKYLNKGLTTPMEIMTKYNLTSLQNADGSWAKCVEKFLKEIEPE